MDHNMVNDGSGLVVVGVDGSVNSRRAFDVAVSFAQQYRQDMKIVAAFTEPGYEYIPADVRGVAAKYAEHILDGFVTTAEGVNVTASAAAIEGDAAGVLIAESEHASLVVVGKRGRSRFAGRFLGSVSASVASHSQCPTLIVPNKRDAEDLPEDEHAKMPKDPDWSEYGVMTSAGVEDATEFRDSVVVGVDVNAHPHDTAMRGARYAEERGLNLVLVTAEPLSHSMWVPVSPIYRAEIPDMRRAIATQLEFVANEVAEETSAPVEWRFFDAQPSDVMAHASRTAELLVVGTRGRGGFTGLLLGSVSQAVLNRSISPVLVIPTTSRD